MIYNHQELHKLYQDCFDKPAPDNPEDREWFAQLSTDKCLMTSVIGDCVYASEGLGVSVVEAAFAAGFLFGREYEKKALETLRKLRDED